MKKILLALFLLPFAATAGSDPLYFGNFRSNAPAGLPGVIRTSETTEGFTLQWENKSGKPLSASIFQQQYLEDPEKISFDLKINRNSGSAWNIELKDTASAVFRRQLNLPEADGMFHRIVVPTGEFKKIQSGFPRVSPSDALKEINTLTLVVAGENGAVFDGEIRNFQIHAGDRSIKLFTREFRNIFGESRRYARPIPIRFQNDRVPRVFVADNTSLFCSLPFREAIRRLHQQFKGHLGVHFNGGMHPGVSESAAFYNALGIKTTFENHVTSGYQDYLTSNRLFLTRDDGFSMNDPANWGKPNRYLWPYHGISIFDERAFLPLRATIDEMAKNGISEYLMIDYIWPWRGRWGYDDATREAFRRDLTGEDAGLLYRSSPGEKYRKIGFFDYLRLFTDYRYTPESLGLKSFRDYSPVTEKQASRGSVYEKRNLFLFLALYHYEYLKFLQKTGLYANSKGIRMVAGTNPEDIANGNDHYLSANLQGVDKLGYEFFGSPAGTFAWYHNMRFFSGHLKKMGKDIYIIGEINNGGHGKTKYSPEAAYAFFYDLSSAAKPSDYNNQYMEAPWDGRLPSTPYHQGRYGHWAAGAYAFLQSFRERPELPSPRQTAVIASRNILEYQSGFSNGMKQAGNLSLFLDQLHYSFDSAGKEGLFDGFCDAADILVFNPAESSSMHFAAARKWLDAVPGRRLILHSSVPFSQFNGGVNLKKNVREILWHPEKSYDCNLENPLVAKNSILGLELAERKMCPALSFADRNRTFRCDRSVYLLKNPGEVLLRAENGLPLVSRIPAGRGEIFYIHAEMPLDRAPEFSRALVDFTMRVAGERPECEADPKAGVHLYDVPGGRALVLWDTPSLTAMEKEQYFQRKILPESRTVRVSAEPETEYLVFHFYDLRREMQRSSREGFIELKSNASCDIIYFGRDSAAFRETLNQLQSTARKVQALNPENLMRDIRENGRELLVNNGFEEGAARPDFWNSFASRQYINAGKPGEEVHRGKASVVLNSPDGNDCRWYSGAVAVTPGSPCLLSAWVKTENFDADDVVQLRIERLRDKQYIGMFAAPGQRGNGSWRKMELLFVPDTAEIRVLLVAGYGENRKSPAAAKAYFDDVSLKMLEQK